MFIYKNYSKFSFTVSYLHISLYIGMVPIIELPSWTSCW